MKRAFQVIGGNVVAMNWGYKPNDITPHPMAPSSETYPLTQAASMAQAGHVIYGYSHDMDGYLIGSKSTQQPMQQITPFSVAQNTSGGIETIRTEKSDISTSEVVQSVSFNNSKDATTPANNKERILVIGDPMGAFEAYFEERGEALAIDHYLADDAIGGTQQKRTAAWLKIQTGVRATRLKNLVVEASDENAFLGSLMELCTIDVLGNVKVVKKDFALQRSGDTFNNKIVRDSEFDFLLNSHNSIALRVPVGAKVTVTFRVKSEESAHQMALAKTV